MHSNMNICSDRSTIQTTCFHVILKKKCKSNFVCIFLKQRVAFKNNPFHCLNISFSKQKCTQTHTQDWNKIHYTKSCFACVHFILNDRPKKKWKMIKKTLHETKLYYIFSFHQPVFMVFEWQHCIRSDIVQILYKYIFICQTKNILFHTFIFLVYLLLVKTWKFNFDLLMIVLVAAASFYPRYIIIIF